VPLPPFFSEKLQNRKILPHFCFFCARRFFFKRKGKFFDFETEILKKFQGGSGAEVKPNFEKMFELGCKSIPVSNFPVFLRFFLPRFSKIAIVFAALPQRAERRG